uniref:CCHC-type domain-containing protein n=1 Tax=Setaria italica TaxID=4555 RepID=K3ZLD5_SETIT
MGPQIEQFVVVSISPPSVDLSKLSHEEDKCLQLNAQASYVLICALSEDVFHAVMDEDDDYDTNHDAQHIWTTLKEMYGAWEDYGQEHKASSSFGSEVASECSNSKDHSHHQPHEKSPTSSYTSSQLDTHKCFMDKGDKKRVDEDEEFEFEIDKMFKGDKKEVVKLMKTMCKQRGELERQEDVIGKIKELESLNEEMMKLNESNVFFLDKCKELEKRYACATNSLSYVAPLEEANQKLKAQLEELSSKYVNLQATHRELECSHGKLVESHTMLELAHEVMITMNDNLRQKIKKLKMDLSKLKGKGIAQPSQDNRDDMVKKLDKGSTLQSSCNHYVKSIRRQKQDNKKKKLDHIKCFKCSKMGHFASMCPMKKENNPALSKRQRILSNRRCFSCHEKGHKIASCARIKPHMKLNKGFLKAQEKYMGGVAIRSQDKKSTSSINHKTCYACRQTGHLGKDCPNGNAPKLKSIHNNFTKLRKNLMTLVLP